MTRDQTINIFGALCLSIADAQQKAAAEAAGLSGSACAALVSLGPYPGMTIGQVARILRLTHSVAVRLVDQLVKDSLIARMPRQDRREVALRLTAEGMRRREKILRARRSVLEDALSTMPRKNHSKFGATISEILVHLTDGRETADHICRLCDEDVCMSNKCPVECQAVRLTKLAL